MSALALEKARAPIDRRTHDRMAEDQLSGIDPHQSHRLGGGEVAHVQLEDRRSVLDRRPRASLLRRGPGEKGPRGNGPPRGPLAVAGGSLPTRGSSPPSCRGVSAAGSPTRGRGFPFVFSTSHSTTPDA